MATKWIFQKILFMYLWAQNIEPLQINKKEFIFSQFPNFSHTFSQIYDGAFGRNINMIKCILPEK